jgi:hypothetical protein
MANQGLRGKRGNHQPHANMVRGLAEGEQHA